MTDRERAFAPAFLHSVLMNEARDYLRRGRRFKSVATTKLSKMWIAAFKSFASGGDTRDADDLGAELRLCGFAPPVAALLDDMMALEASIKKTVPDMMPALEDKLYDDFLADMVPPN
jgi:hypothetical protein